MTTNRAAAAATIFSRRWAPPPPLISQPSGVTWSVPSIAMSRFSRLPNSSTGMPRPARLFLGRDRGRDAADAVEPARGERRQQVGDRRAGPEPDRHSVLDQLRGGLGGESLLVVGASPVGTLCSERWMHGSGSRGGRRAPLGGAARGAAPSSAATPRPTSHRGRGDLLEPSRDREPRRGADGDRPRQPQRHRAQWRAARPSPPPARRRHADGRRPPARSLRPAARPGRGNRCRHRARASRSRRRSGRQRRPWSRPTAPRAPSPAVPRPAPRSPPSFTSASAPPSAGSSPSPPNSTFPATLAASAPASSLADLGRALPTRDLFFAAWPCACASAGCLHAVRRRPPRHQQPCPASHAGPR